jgi:hypothetical protein
MVDKMLKYHEPAFLDVMRKRGVTLEDISAAGGVFVDGFYINTKERHDAMLAKARAAKPFGLGDAVASVAQPIAGALDRVLGTNIKGCGGCAQRRETLNAIIPDLRALTERKTDV